MIWDEAQSAILVNAPRRDSSKLAAENKLSLRINSRSVLRAFVREMRVRQWAKNLLVFVALAASHTYGDPTAVTNSLLAFFAFSLCASGVYFLNDLLDLEADRAHVTKRARPLAAGELPMGLAIAAVVLFPIAALALALALLPPLFALFLALYFLLTNAYSLVLKKSSAVDVMTLAVLYTLRVIAGAAAISVVVSTWLLAFSVFIFVSLAYLKRYVETAGLQGADEKARGRGYYRGDQETMFTLGVANATASVVVLALYLNSAEVTKLYPNSQVLWLLCLLLLFWTNRIWIRARRGQIHDDPLVFAISDRVSQLTGLLFIIVVLAGRFWI